NQWSEALRRRDIERTERQDDIAAGSRNAGCARETIAVESVRLNRRRERSQQTDARRSRRIGRERTARAVKRQRIAAADDKIATLREFAEHSAFRLIGKAGARSEVIQRRRIIIRQAIAAARKLRHKWRQFIPSLG